MISYFALLEMILLTLESKGMQFLAQKTKDDQQSGEPGFYPTEESPYGPLPAIDWDLLTASQREVFFQFLYLNFEEIWHSR